QTEYSLWTRDPEEEILPTVRELGIGFVAYSPIGRGFLSGRIKSVEDLEQNDYRRQNPRFKDQNFEKNFELVKRVERIGREKHVTPAPPAPPGPLAQGTDTTPTPGSPRIQHLEENAAAASLELTKDALARIDEAAPQGVTAGDRYPDMSRVNL